MLKYNPDERYSANQAIRHPYFRDLFEKDCRLSIDNNYFKGNGTSNESTYLNKLYNSFYNKYTYITVEKTQLHFFHLIARLLNQKKRKR